MPPHKPTAEDLAAAAERTVPDLIAPGLDVLFCGINPSLYTAAVGHHFAHPANRFWPALHAAGFTARRLAPEEEPVLLRHGYGITNLVDRATTAAAELSADELRAGRDVLAQKLRRYAPRWLAVLGVGAYRTAFGERGAQVGAQVGPQPEPFAGSQVWVLPNPSGLNAHYPPTKLAAVFRALREAI